MLLDKSQQLVRKERKALIITHVSIFFSIVKFFADFMKEGSGLVCVEKLVSYRE